MTYAATARDERTRLLRDLRAAERRYRELLKSRAEVQSLHRAQSEMRQRLEEYFESLPRIAVAPCPFDGRVLVRSFDPFGFDGPWWGSNAAPKEPPACPHFCVMGGAVRFDGRPARGGEFRALTGPEVPFVYPRVLAMPGMLAVVSELPMDHGLLAYAISYFAERRPPPQHLVGGWRRTTHGWVTQLGETGFRIENDPWDFDLGPWLARGKLRWCPPGSDNTKLADPTGPCPYVDLPGQRKYLLVSGDSVGWRALPDGRNICPFDP